LSFSFTGHNFVYNRQAGGSLPFGEEESPGSTGQGAGVEPGRGNPAERATENRPP